MAQKWVGRILPAVRLGPARAMRAFRDERNMRLLLAFTLGDDSNCIDVGSNEGLVLADIVRLAPNGHHIAFEPLPHLYDRLKATFPAVEVRNVALADSDGSSAFMHVRNMPAYSGLRRRAYPTEPDIEVIKITTQRLDGHLPNGYVPNLIKIDVEGAEQLVIEGALETIKEHRPTILFEHGRGASDYYGGSPSAVHRLLCGEAGLRIFDLDGNGPYSAIEFKRTYERNDRWNFVAHA